MSYTRVELGQSEIYNGNLQQGGGIGRFLKKADRAVGKISDYADKRNIVSGIKKASDLLGTTGAIDAATGNAFSRVTDYAKQKGYGKKKQKGKGKKKSKK